MSIYFIVFFFLALLSFTDLLPVRKDQRQLLVVLVSFVLVFVAGLRGEGFADYTAYRLYFESWAQGDPLAVVAAEPGYIVINNLVGFFTRNAVWLFLTMAFLAISINIKSYSDYTPFAFIAIMAYFSHTYLGRELMQIRAGVAAAIVLYSYRFVIKQRFWTFFFWVCIGASIHLGALVALVVYPFCKIKIGPKGLWLVLLGCLVMGFVMPMGAVIRLIPEMAALERIQSYNDSEMYAGDLGIFTNPTLLKQLLILGIGLFFFSQLNKKVAGYRVFLISYFLSTCWLILFNDFAILSARVATFFSITEVVLLANYTYLFERKSRYIYLIWVILLTFAMLLLNVSGNKIASYHTVFDSV